MPFPPGKGSQGNYVRVFQAETLHTQILIAQKQEGLRVADEDWWRLCNFEMSLVSHRTASSPCASVALRS